MLRLIKSIILYQPVNIIYRLFLTSPLTSHVLPCILVMYLEISQSPNATKENPKKYKYINHLITYPMETLTPVNGRKSFYGKCKMINGGDSIQLKSYDTIVAEFNQETGIINVFGWYSRTTASHINSFLNHFGLTPANKKEMEDWTPRTA